MFGMGRSTAPAPAPAKPKSVGKKAAPVPVTVRLEPRLREKFEALGGETWLRKQLEAAQVDGQGARQGGPGGFRQLRASP